MMQLTLDTLKKIIHTISMTHENEIDCDGCFEQLDRFAEIKLQGKEINEATPLVEEHLARCGDCREEFEALLDAINNNP